MVIGEVHMQQMVPLIQICLNEGKEMVKAQKKQIDTTSL